MLKELRYSGQRHSRAWERASVPVGLLADQARALDCRARRDLLKLSTDRRVDIRQAAATREAVIEVYATWRLWRAGRTIWCDARGPRGLPDKLKDGALERQKNGGHEDAPPAVPSQ
jgi:hypothetical protein